MMVGRLSQGQLRSVAVGVVGLALTAAPAKPTEYSCRVPRALLCEGCASQIAIALQPGGSCRISFTPEPPSPAAKDAPDQLEFRVEAAPAPTPRPVAPRISANWRAHRLAFARPAAARHCFIFKTQEYCE